MKDIQVVLQRITDIVEKYESGKWVKEKDLAEMNRQLSACIYYITTEQVEAHQRWNAEYHNFEGNNAQKERNADKEVWELYQYRKVIEAARGVNIAMGYELRMDG